MNIFELFGSVGLKGADGVNRELSTLEKRTQQVQKGMKIMGAAFTAVGVAGLAIIQSTKKINAQLSMTAINLGLTTKEMRDLTLATTNVTFPINEVTATFDLLARAGVKSQEILKSTATAFDTLGDATGNTASVTGGIMIDAMKTFGLTAEEIASKGDMMTHMARNSTIGLEDFATMVGYTDQEMVAAGLTIEDMAAMMMYMGDSGIAPGKVMLREWNQAVTESKKEGISMAEALGMTTEQVKQYKDGLENSTGTMQEYADAANDQYSIMDKLKQKWSEVTLGMSGFLEPLEPILAGMTAMGPLMMIMSTSAGTGAVKFALQTVALIAHKVALIASVIAMKAVTVAQWLWNAAMTANPIGLIIMAIAGLIAIIVLVVKNWDWVKGKAAALWNKLKEIFTKIGNFFKNIWDKITGVFKAAWNGLVNIVKTAVNFVLGIINSMITGFEAAINFIIRGINAFIGLMNKPIELLNKIPGVNLPIIPTIGQITLPKIPLMDLGGVIEGPGVFAVGRGVKEVVREPGAGGISIHIGYFMGDDIALRKFHRMMKQVAGEEGRLSRFDPIRSGNYYESGRASL